MTDDGTRRTPPFASLLALAVNRSGVLLLVIGLVDSIGTGMYLAGSAIYFTRIVGLSTAQVGIGLSVAGVLGFAAQPLLGWTADRIGAKRLLIIMNLLRAAGFTAYVFVGDFTSFLLVAALLGIPEQAVFPIYQSLVERVVGPEHRLKFMARIRAMYNIGFTIGALLATIALNIASRAAFQAIFLVNALTFLVAALLLPRVVMIVRTATSGAGERRMRLSAVRDRRYLTVAGVNGILTLHMSVLSIAMPLWITLHTDAPAALVGPLLVVNTVLAVTLQVRATRGTETVPGGARALRRAAIALTVTCVLFVVATRLSAVWAAAVLVAAVIALTAGELLQSAGGWALSYQLAPERSRAEYLATFNMGTSAQFIAGPTIVTVGVIQNGAAGWFALGGLFVLTAFVIRPVVAAAQQRPELGAPDHRDEPAARA